LPLTFAFVRLGPGDRRTTGKEFVVRELWLPYSPNINPPENAFSEHKALLRKLAARTKETFWQALGPPLSPFGPTVYKPRLQRSRV